MSESKNALVPVPVPGESPGPGTSLGPVSPARGTRGSNQSLSIFDLAKHAYQSGMFKKLPNASAAVMILQVGRDVGIADTAALNSIHFFEGKPTMSGHLLWSLVLASPEYRKTRVKSKSDKGVTIHWIREVPGPDGKPERILDAEDSFTEEDAKRAGLTGKDNWKKFPRAMLFNRAVSSGFKMYAAHLSMGNVVYTPDELGAEINEDGELAAGPSRYPTTDVSDAEFTISTEPAVDSEPPPANLAAALAGSSLTPARVAIMLGLEEADLAEPTPEQLRKIGQLAANQKKLMKVGS